MGFVERGFVALTSFALACQASAQPTPNVVREWLAGELERAREIDPIDYFRGLELEHVVESHETPSPNELARMRRAVEGHPDHPDRQRLAVFERRRHEGPDISRRRLFLGSQDRWRWCTGPTEGAWMDYCFSGRTAWLLSDGSLSIFSRGRGFPPQQDLSNELQLIRTYLAKHVFRGIDEIASADVSIESVTIDEGSWRAGVHVQDFDSTILFEGRWDSGREAGIIDRMTLVSVPAAPELEGASHVFSGSVETPGDSGGWPEIARSVQTLFPDGRVDEVWILESLAPVSESRLTELLRLPEHGQHDAVRGTLQFADRTDWRSGDVRLTEYTRSGKATTGALSWQQNRTAKVMAIAVACCVVVLIVVIAWRKQQAVSG